MYEELLEQCGLTKNESLTYLALLKLGKSKSGDIVREAKVSGGKIYETLYKLIDKGLVKEVSENGIKRFIANNPRTIISYIKEKQKNLDQKEKELEKILPSFLKISGIDKEHESVSLVKGLRGISDIVYQKLENAKKIKIMGVNSSKDEKYNTFWRNWHKERVNLKKEAQIIFSDKNTEYWKFFKNLNYTKLRELLHFSPSAVMIIDDNSFLFSYEKDLTCIHIQSIPMSNSLSSFFDDLWKIAKI
ncbi:MAG: helix-turn-helix domain-containing protein [archaeon]